MALTTDFYALLSSLLRQTAQNPDAPPAIPINHWPVESEERCVLEDLQAALATLQTGDQDHPSRVKQGERLYQSIFESASDGLIIHDLETSLVVEANPAACMMHGYARDEFIGLHPTSFIHPDSSHQFTKYVQAVQSEGRFETLEVHLHRDRTLFHVELHGTMFNYQNRPCLLSIVRDVNQRVQAERLLQERVETRTREQSTLLKISQTLASALELQPGLILDQLRVIVDYAHAGLFKLDESTLAALAVHGPQRLEQAMPFRIWLENSGTLAELFK